ncbi:MAG: pyridoxamine 5'-phosphate oxidase [Bacteroidales bacterium]|jgi:pyridoxamine-phosphate oxidase|nr:pyridoxamine 5'-phosphate oxidase [Bacteroidales bacterium]MDD3273543.1 pyridoxamine 5'-phosphate oxidase [Bacteroidales bacterium]MDD4057505.1 pyridoxamine 5'-phosphate oxidase [Bacteroidales bacterium]
MKEQVLYNMRKDYSPEPLILEKLSKSPLVEFGKWFEEAEKTENQEINAMILSTCKNGEFPSSRVVLLKRYSNEGFVFFTNYHSRKGEQIDSNPKGSILFFWPQTMRQIRIEGEISRISSTESDEYFASRPAESRASAILSKQSKPLNDKERFDNEVKELSNNKELKRPNNWGGYILKPVYFEFWQGATNRTHDRFSYTPTINGWMITRLYP